MDLRASLHGAGFNVTACESRASARQALRVRTYAVAVVDAHLPDGNGIDFLKEIRSVQPGVRAIVTAVDADARLRALAVASGAEDLLRKPIEMVPLLRLAVKLAGSPARARAPESTRSPVQRRRILIVDGDPVFRRALADSLRGDGEEVLMGASAEEAMALLSVDRVDAVLVDYRLPEAGGLELCRRIRSQSLQRFVPLLVVARPTDDVDAYRKAMGAGADDLVVRSKEPAMVKIRLRGLLNRAQRERDKREGKGPPRTALEEMSASLPTPSQRPAVAATKKRSVPPPPGGFRDRSAKSPSVPPPSGGLRARRVPHIPPSQRGPVDPKDEPGAAALSGWLLPRNAGEDRISEVLPGAAESSREPRSQPSSHRPLISGKS
jgi:DNA-binding response OmpR family regulator